MKRKRTGDDLCRQAMIRLADRYKTRDMSLIGRVCWDDYAAIRILEVLMTLCSMTESNVTRFPVCYGFQKTER